MPKQHNLDQKMLLESMMDDEDNDQNDSVNQNHRLSRKTGSMPDRHGPLLILDGEEHLAVSYIGRKTVQTRFVRSTH
jgi:hypothetical protein